MKNTVLSIVGQRWRELIGFALLFRVLESLLFAPLPLWPESGSSAGRCSIARRSFRFFSHRAGFSHSWLAAVAALSIRLTEHAGLSAIFFGAFDGRRVSSRESPAAGRGASPDLVRVSRASSAWDC